jgi:hypothetical protein
MQLWHDQSSAVICLRRHCKKHCDRAFVAVVVRILNLELVLLLLSYQYCTILELKVPSISE